MAEETRQQTEYTLGNTIRIELEVSDESGVGEVRARFSLVDNLTQSIFFSTTGSGETKDDTIILEKEVTEDIAPGEYECQWIALEDMRGNQNLISSPGIRFRVDNVPGDHDPPELKGWRTL